MHIKLINTLRIVLIQLTTMFQMKLQLFYWKTIGYPMPRTVHGFLIHRSEIKKHARESGHKGIKMYCKSFTMKTSKISPFRDLFS